MSGTKIVIKKLYKKRVISDISNKDATIAHQGIKCLCRVAKKVKGFIIKKLNRKSTENEAPSPVLLENLQMAKVIITCFK